MPKYAVKATDGQRYEVQNRNPRTDQNGVVADIIKSGGWTDVLDGVQRFIPPHAIVLVEVDSSGDR